MSIILIGLTLDILLVWYSILISTSTIYLIANLVRGLLHFNY